MQLTVMRHLWGYDAPWAEALPEIAVAGYDGVEPGMWEFDDDEIEPFAAMATEFGFGIVAGAATNDFDGPADVATHLLSLRRQVEKALPLRPLFINSMSGSDTWSLAETLAFFEEALHFESRFGVTILHETHRGRCLFNSRDTAVILTELPELKVTADLSHWVCVAERYDGFPPDELDLVFERTHHIHARVGYAEGPQVPDPRAPEYAAEVAAHEAWWDQIWDSMAERGLESSTLTPEFGPYPYQQALPYSGDPVADLREVCDWQARRQRFRFEERFGPHRHGPRATSGRDG
jgi:hypothetical protein